MAKNKLTMYVHKKTNKCDFWIIYYTELPITLFLTINIYCLLLETS